jgi:hypothetical protein
MDETLDMIDRLSFDCAIFDVDVLDQLSARVAG